MDCYDRCLSFSNPVAVLYTPEKDFRAAITRRNSGGYQVIYEQLIPFDEEELKYLSDGSLAVSYTHLDVYKRQHDAHVGLDGAKRIVGAGCSSLCNCVK